MPKDNPQEVLDQLLASLKSENPARQLEAMQELGSFPFSSEGIVRQLERLALGEDTGVRAAALAALKLTTTQYVKAQNTDLAKFTREKILAEVDGWENKGYILRDQAEVIRRQYDFDVTPGTPIKPTQAVVPAPVEAAPAPQPATPQPITSQPVRGSSLTHVLLSETSIRIYLYLGAFFVIAAAAILAALVEAARLPVLLATTLAFAAGAVGLKSRLPQPSFALAIVFSFLLPIDANVLADSLSLSGLNSEIYWTFLFLLMAVIWAAGTWFYSSRLFSLAAFLSLSLAALRLGDILDATSNWKILLIALVNLLGLLGVKMIKNWRGAKFSTPLFALVQGQQAILLFIAYGVVTNDWLGAHMDSTGEKFAALLAWLSAAAFYAASDLLFPFLFFPWLAAGSLFLIPWLFTSAIHDSGPVVMLGYCVWGALAALASEFVHRFDRATWKKYHFPLLALSLPLFLTAILIGFLDEVIYGFAACLATAIVYTLIHVFRPRWYVWLAALIAGVGAYFAFFALPFMEKADIHFSYQLLGASLLLLIPELFLKSGFSFTRAWNWPPVLLGVAAIMFNLLTVPFFSQHDRSAIVFGVAALLFTAYALRYKQPLLGYFTTACAVLAVIFALLHFDRDWWLPALTALSLLYYASGFLLARREGTRPWGMMLIYSGLALGVLLSIVTLFTLKETGGWYVLVIATLAGVEMFTRRRGILEFLVEILLSFALVLLMNDFQVEEPTYFIFGLSLLWFTCDALFKFTFPQRINDLITKGVGIILTFLTVVFMLTIFPYSYSAACFGIYTLFFAVYAWLHRNPPMGYASTAMFALTVYFSLLAAKQEHWLLPLIALAAVYYAAGFTLRHLQKATGWDKMLLFSGLGLGTLVAIQSPSQSGGLEKAIPIAIAATFYAAEAFVRRKIWLGFPANALYLTAYFTILSELKVDEPQFYSVGAAALGLLMHYLLRRAGNRKSTFITGMLSQFVLLGATYIQMVDTGESRYFFVLFFQALVVLAYGIVTRSKSLVIAPIGFAVLAVISVLYNALKDLSLVVIIGVTGVLLIGIGILAVVMRERITTMAERFSDWEA